METYRRRAAARPRADEGVEKSGWRTLLLKQTAVCIAALLGVIFVQSGDEAAFEPVRRGARLVLETDADFAGLYEDAKNVCVSFFTGGTGGGEAAEESAGARTLANLGLPLAGAVESKFGMRVHPLDGVEKFHFGVDLSGAPGDAVACACDGTVERAGFDEENGNFLLVSHEGGVSTFYAHCERVLAEEGEAVSKGKIIAAVGDTGKTTGPHLHFEIREGETSLDPEAFLTFGAAQ
jgi:murein DD-endopeptidase MepM/ murein hydrolase activator NlpD